MFHGIQPVIVKSPEIARKLQNRPTKQSISELEELIANPDSEKLLAMPFSQETENFIYEHSDLDSRPYLFCSRTAIVNIIDIVRNTVLEWSLKLEEGGITGDGLSFSKEEKKIAESNKSIHIQNFQGVLGDVVHSTISQSNTMNIPKADFESLSRFLESKGIEPDEIKELKEAVEQETEIKTPGKFGTKVSSWIGNMITKAASGTWKVGCEVATKLLTAALMQYYGYH
jgi:hypothetical protein